MLNDRIQAANRIRPSETSTLRHIAMRKGVRLSARGSQRQGSYAWGECAEPVGKNGWADGRKFRLKKHGRKSVGALGGVKIVPPPAPSRDDVREVTHRWMRQRKMVMGGEWFTAAIERSQWAEASKRGNQPQGMTREVLPAIESILASYARSRKTFKAHLGEEDFIVTFHSDGGTLRNGRNGDGQFKGSLRIPNYGGTDSVKSQHTIMLMIGREQDQCQ